MTKKQQKQPQKMSASIDKAIGFVLEHEGGFVDHPNDPGGATNYGVSLRALLQLEGHNKDEWDIDKDGDIDADDMKLITKDQATRFYRDHYWHWSYSLLPQTVATKVFDMSVNMGPKQAGKILQRACNARLAKPLLVDGAVGPMTIKAAQKVKEPLLLYLLCAEQARFYFGLVDRRPSRGVFLLGWLRRAYSMPT